MVKFSRVTAAVIAVLLVGASALVGATPASAAIVPDFDNIMDLFNYKILKSGTELQAAMGPTARAAWSAQTARMATQSASAYNIAAATSGLTEVKPDPIYLRPQDLPAIKPTGGFKNFTTKFTGVGLNKPSGVIGVTAAMVGYEFRADIANGITSLLGFDATGLVCGDPTASGGFVNWITGQDCSAMALDPNYVPNEDGGGWSGHVCYSAGGVCADVIDLRTPYTSTFVGKYQVVVKKTGGTPIANWSLNVRYTEAGVAKSSPAVFRYNGAQAVGLPGDPVYGWPVGDVMNPLTVTGICLENCSNPANFVSVVEFEADPDRWWVCDYTGDDGNHYTRDSSTFKEGSGFTAAVLCPDLPSGVEATHMRITLMGGPEPLIVSDEDALDDPLGDGSETNGVTTDYCISHVCVLELMDLRSGKSCFDSGDACDGWLQSPTRDTDYQCYYGGVAQAASQCYVYAQVFNTAKRLAGQPYADPKTGEDTGAQSGLSLDELTMANDPRPAAFGRNCFGGDWGAANPVNWVLRPIQCALEWAFVARPSVVTANATVMQSAWNTTAPGRVVTAVQGWSFQPGSSGCAGPHVVIPFFGLSGYPLSACPGTMLASIAAPTRIITGVGLVLGGAFVLLRIVSGVVGYRGIE